jgi:hypothetical protein
MATSTPTLYIPEMEQSLSTTSRGKAWLLANNDSYPQYNLGRAAKNTLQASQQIKETRVPKDAKMATLRSHGTN